MLPKAGKKSGDKRLVLKCRASADNERQRWKREEQFGTPWNEECGKVLFGFLSKRFASAPHSSSSTFPSPLSICSTAHIMSSDTTPAYSTLAAISKPPSLPAKAPPGNVFSNDGLFLERIRRGMKVRNLSWFPFLFLGMLC
jgi:hypothetical protein